MHRKKAKSKKKKQNGLLKAWVSVALLAVLICTGVAPMAAPEAVYAEEELPTTPTHGTATDWITEDMLNNTPPADYVVNQASQGKAKNGDYNAYFLEDEIQTVYIEIDENNLNYLLQNAIDEPYVMTTSVTIGDTTLGYCGLKTKGSYTLEHSVTENEGSDRFSFTINFGKYIKKKDYGEKQNFYGCDKISFNNFFFDKTMMKEFFALKLMDEMGLPTPQYGLAKLYINGEYYGVYAMVEAMDSSILEQYYGVGGSELSSYLCKPEGTNFLYDEILADPSPLWEQDEDTLKDVEDMIPTVTEWVRKLNCLSDGTDFEGNVLDVNGEDYIQLLDQILDTDEVVKYFAVHSWLCQMDNMFVGQKNFGLYVDQNGRALMVPWDYDLSFGCYYPSTAENTANYPLDVMYRLDMRDKAKESQISAETYAAFPLFHVIYQNDALMEQFHAYMKECSKIAALGGTIASTGKTYEPGYFNSFVETMQEAVVAAATEKLADNVYYMNNINQPSGVKKGLPNLAKILALRAVGVMNQVTGEDATVCAYGCDLSTLGNAIKGDYSKGGRLTAVDAATGIYATADYTGGKNATAPQLTVEQLASDEVIFSMFSAEIGSDGDDTMIVYKISNKATPTGSYTLTLPMTQEMMQAAGEFKFYSHIGGALQEFTMTADDNLYTGEVSAIDYIVVVKGTGTSAGIGTSSGASGTAGDEADCGMPDNGQDDTASVAGNAGESAGGLAVFPVILAFGVLVVVLVIVVIVVKGRKK